MVILGPFTCELLLCLPLVGSSLLVFNLCLDGKSGEKLDELVIFLNILLKAFLFTETQLISQLNDLLSLIDAIVQNVRGTAILVFKV